MKRYPIALTIAGSDSGGGAGIQADLKTFSALGVFGASVITAITAQNTREVRCIETLSTEIIRLQLETVLDDITVDAVKTGMLPTPEIIEVVAAVIDKYNINKIVIDPVMVASTGARLTGGQTVDAFREFLYKRLLLITPNIPEAEVLSGIRIKSEKDIRKAGERLLDQGCKAVLIKGGHIAQSTSIDFLFTQGKDPVSFSAGFIPTQNLHGTGCSLASAITAYLALGKGLEEAVRSAKEYITQAITSGSDIQTGQGSGPINHFFHPQSLNTIEYDNPIE